VIFGWKIVAGVVAGALLVIGLLLWRVDHLAAARDLERKDRAAVERELTVAQGVNERQRATIRAFDEARARAAQDAAVAAARAHKLSAEYDKLIVELRHAEDGPMAPVLRRAYDWVRVRDAADGAHPD
jgi:hypothetical protein